ncbi:MAG: hypothetical protein Kow0090_15050 [Myxococcota bacterium]
MKGKKRRPATKPSEKIAAFYRRIEKLEEVKREQKNIESALKESERKLFTLLGNLPGLVYRCRNDRDWTMEFVSQGCFKLTGYKPSDLVGNRILSYNDLIHPDDREPVWNEVQKALAKNRPFRLIYRIITKSGDEKWVWEQGVGVFAKKGKQLLALEGFITDITERKTIEDMLKQKNKELEASYSELNQLHCELGKKTCLLETAIKKLEETDKAKNEFMANISHELRTPLVAIKGFLELMQRGELGRLSGEQERAIQIAGKNLNKLTMLIENLLAFSSFAERGKKAKSEIGDITAIVESAVMLLEPLIKEKKIEVSLKTADKPLYFLGDPQLVERAMANVLSNAVKFNRQEGKISIELKGEGDLITIITADTGVGIKKSDLPRIFERFFKGESTHAHKYGGMGIGLAIAREIIEAHKGDIRVESEYKKGAVVTVTLPKA